MDKKKIWGIINRYMLIEALLFAVLLIVDLITKWQVTLHFPREGMGIPGAIPHLFNIVYVKNTGAAFGMMENARWFFIIITFVAVLAFGFVLVRFRNQGRLFRISLALILAGAIGNLIDRIFLGFVRDFIQFAFWTNFPVFNVADVALVVGVIMLAVWLIFFYKEKDKAKKAAPGVATATAESAAPGPEAGSEPPAPIAPEPAGPSGGNNGGETNAPL